MAAACFVRSANILLADTTDSENWARNSAEIRFINRLDRGVSAVDPAGPIQRGGVSVSGMRVFTPEPARQPVQRR
jgi:hypothetical protein